LDINNTIDHRPEGDEKWFLENEKTVTQFCRKLAAERPLKDIRDEYNYPKKKGIKDECSRLLEASTMKLRRGFAVQRLMNEMRQAHADVWFIVFDTLTLADDRLESFYDNPDRKSGSAGMPRPISYAVFCWKKKNSQDELISIGHDILYRWLEYG